GRRAPPAPRPRRPRRRLTRRRRRRRRLQRTLPVRRREGLHRLRGGDRTDAAAARRHRSGAVRAPAQRGRPDARRPAGDHRPREPLAREGGGPARVGRLPGARGQRRPRLPRSGLAVVGAEPAHPHADALARARARARRDELRGPRQPPLPRAPVPADLQQRVQPVAGGRHDRQARRGGDDAHPGVLDGQPSPRPRIRRRRARGDRGRALRRGAHQPLLPRAHAGRGRRLPGGAGVARPGRRRGPHQPVGRRARQGLRASRGRHRADGAPDRPRRPARGGRQRRAAGQRAGRSRRAHPRLGRRQEGPDRRRPRRPAAAGRRRAHAAGGLGV
ncbi:MAG: Ferric iron ABC transporter, iron-binding protein, partial [uncultured Solirubrobacteraceae bacterium]